MGGVRRTDGRRELRGGAGKRVEWCLLDGLRAFGINAHQCMTTAKDEGGWCETVEQGAERFMVKLIAAEKARGGLRYAVKWPNVTRNTKSRIGQREHTRAGSLAIVD